MQDGDGDTDTATVHLVIGDDGPEIYFPTDQGPQAEGGGVVDEDDLDTGDGDAVNGSDQSQDSAVTRPVAVDFGEDGPAAQDALLFEDPAVSGDLAAMGLTSGGTALTYTIDPTSTVITGSAGGDAIFTMTLSGDPQNGYSYTFDLIGQLDHDTAQGQNLIEDIPFGLIATDGDGSTANGVIKIDVVDDVPEAKDDGTVTAEENGPAITGNVLDNDIEGADGADLTSFTYTDANGTPQVANAGDTVTTEYGTLTVNSDGSYTYQANSDIPGNETVDVFDGFTYTITDGDGDTDTAELKIKIGEDVPTITFKEPGEPDAATGDRVVDEDDLGTEQGDVESGTDQTGASSVSQGINIDFGDDGPAASDPVVLEIPTALTNMGLTSDGQPLSYTLSQDGQTITANNGTDDVFTLTLNHDPQDGYSYTFDLMANLDHATGQGENLVEDIPFTVVVTDGNGSVARGEINIDVVDDVPEIGPISGPVAAQTVTVDEDDTADGTDGSQSTSATGTLGLSGITFGATLGADADNATATGGGVNPDPSGLTIEGPAGLTSGGVPITYSQTGNVLTGSAGGDTIFTVTLNGDDTYTFNLVGSVDHPAGQDENSMELEFGLTGTMSANASVTDGDGDTVNADDVTIDHSFKVEIVDDVPVATADQNAVGTAFTGSVDEDDLADGTDDTKEGLTTGGDLGLAGRDLINIDYGADGPAAGSPTALQYGDLDYTLTGPSGLTSQGDAILYSYDANTDTLTAEAGGREVFTVQLNADGSYTFELKDSIDHQDANGENVENLTFGLVGKPSADALNSADFDQDTVDGLGDLQITQQFTVGVVDDVPTAEANTGAQVQAGTASVDEDDLADGTDGSDSLSDTATLGLGNTELIAIDYGADGPAAGAPTGLTYGDLDWAIQGPANLTSNGDPITYSQTGDVLTAEAGGREVFTVTLNADGSYTFELKDQIDHEDANGQNVESLDFGLVGTPDADAVTDYDLDPAAFTGVTFDHGFSVDVTDDVPVAQANQQYVGEATDGSVDEDDLADGTDDTKESLTTGGDLALANGRPLVSIDYGADGPAAGAPDALEYSDMDWTIAGPTGLTSNGDTVTYSYDDATDTLTAEAGGREVFTVQANPDGTYTFELKDQIDHVDANGQNVEDLQFSMVGVPSQAAKDAVRDYDNDAADGLDSAQITQTFGVDVVDDVPVAQTNQDVVGTAVTGAVDEDDLADGTDDTKESLTTGGDLGLAGGRDLVTIDYGADGPAANAPDALEYSDMDWTIAGPAGLTSNGDAVTYSYDDATDTLTAEAGGREVFTVQANADGTYTFELKDQIDHVDANGQNVENLQFSMVGVPSQDVKDAVRDFDQDAADGLDGAQITQSFAVDVTDDVPVAVVDDSGIGQAQSVSLDEDDLADGTDDTKESLSASGDLGLGNGDLITIDYGADGPANANAPTGLTAADLVYSFDETNLPSLTSNGDTVTYSQSNGVLTAEAGGRTVFTVSIDPATGDYTFTLSDQIDHQTANGQNVEGLTFDIIGKPDAAALAEKDFDQDAIDGLADAQITQSFGVDIVDDVPVARDEADVSVRSTDETVGSANGGANLLANDSYGADGPEGNQAEVVGFTYTDENGNQATGTIGQPADTEYGTLTVNADGTWTYMLDQDVTQQQMEAGFEDSFSYTIRDFDGDESTAQQTLVVDGPGIYFPPPYTENGEPVADAGQQVVDEDDLDTDDGDSVDGTDQDNVDNSHTGQAIFVNFGADGPAAQNALVFEDPAVSGDLAGKQLTSDGTPLTYTMNPEGTVITGSAGGDTIFTMTLNGDPQSGYSYDFDLVGPLDHAAGQGENLVQDIPFKIIATDGNGTQSKADIEIDVVDDVPVVKTDAIAVGQAESVSVDEDDLADGTDDTKESLSASGDLGFGSGTIVPIDYGADGPADGAPDGLGFADMDWTITGPSGLTSNGDAITYSQTGNVLTATADGREVFTVEANPDGTYTFTLKDQIDHEDANGQNVEGLNFGISGTPSADAIAAALDNDGDPVAGLDAVEVTQNFGVDIVDDVPVAQANQGVIGTATAGSVDEDDLADGTDDTKEGLSASGDLGLGSGDLITIDYGADGPADGAPQTGLGYDDLNWTVEGPAGLTSQGEAVVYSYDENTDTLTGTAGGREVFTVTLDGNGGYTFTLKDSLDHADAQGENLMDLGFTLTGVPSAESLAGTDYDQDAIEGLADASVTQDFSVTVVDDVPVATVNELTTGGQPVIKTGRVDHESYDDPDTGFTVTAQQILPDGTLSSASLDNVSVGNSTGGPGIGVKATPESGVAGQLGYDPTEALSEVMTIDFDYDVTSVTFTVANLFQTEYVQGEGIEEGHVVAYKDGQVVAEFDFTANTGSNQGTYTINIPEGQSIDQLVFTANPYQDGTPDGDDGQTTNQDSSDYWITGIDFTYIDPDSTGGGGTEVTGETVIIDEDDLREAEGASNDGSDQDRESLSASGDLNLTGHDLITIDYGADGPAPGAKTALQYEDLDFSFDLSGMPTDLTANGDAVTFSQSNGVLTATADAGGAGEREVFTITLNADGTYTFELMDNLDHPVFTEEDVLTFDIALEGVPKEGVGADFDLDPADLNGLVFTHGFKVAVVDDVPTAVDDAAQTLKEGGETVIGNVMDNDVQGADGAEITSFTYTAEDGSTQTGQVGVAVDTQYGTLTVNSDGSYSYTSDANEDHSGGDPLTEGFTYTLTDGDNDVSTATQTFTITDDGPTIDPPTPEPPNPPEPPPPGEPPVGEEDPDHPELGVNAGR
ncbi:MAG: DUF5801 repeats-in-toxin domain-containing protein, partial [Alphaproteobacteria bacterium]